MAPGHSHVLSCSCGEKSGEGMGSLLHHKPDSFPARDVVVIAGLLPIFLYGCKINYGSGLGTRQDITKTTVPYIIPEERPDTYRIAENFRGRKLSRISRFCGYMQKFSLQNLERGILWLCKSEQSAKVFPAKIVFSPIHESFLPRKFPAIQYGIRETAWE